jgi:hypothetical protein
MLEAGLAAISLRNAMSILRAKTPSFLSLHYPDLDEADVKGD